MLRAGRPLRPAPLLLAVTVVVSAAGCSGSSVPSGRSGEPSASSFRITKVDVQSAMPPAPALPDAVRAGVVTTLNRYLNEGVLVPLRSGTAGDVSSAFTAAAAGRLGGPDRSALLDEGLPRSGDVQAKTAEASLSALAGAGGDVPIVTANVKVQVVSGSGGGAVTIDRTGDLIFVEDGGTWEIDGYDVTVARDSAGTTATTSAHK